MSRESDNLRQARINAGYDSPVAAAKAIGVPYPTYAGHENGSRGLSRVAMRYAKFFKVDVAKLLSDQPLKPSETPDIDPSGVAAGLQKRLAVVLSTLADERKPFHEWPQIVADTVRSHLLSLEIELPKPRIPAPRSPAGSRASTRLSTGNAGRG